jgi:signal transduction histidine kinase
MAISVAILALLGVTTVLMLLSTRRAQRLARQQMDFVAAVSHELRTPLTAIRSAGQNLADGIIHEPDRVQSYGVLIEREGRRLTEMIGRVLTFAGIRSGRQIYRLESTDVATIVRASLKDSSWVLEENGFEVVTEIAGDLPRVKGDAAALRQVVISLIDNAVKYAAAGRWLGIRVGCEPEEGGGQVWISISDHGPGIPKKDLPLIFEPFHRGTDAVESTIPGSGLGLAVVRSVVEAHGGSVDVTSTSGVGATFTVRLPEFSVVAVERKERR